MPRTRSARVAVLGSVERRPASASAPSRSSAALKRRVVVVGLAVVSLVLVTVYFRESRNGTLHELQSTGASVLRPFEVAAERIARPFRDAAGWVDDVLDAKAENAKLKGDNERLRQQAIVNEAEARKAKEYERALRVVQGPRFPEDYRPVITRVIARAPAQYEQTVIVAAGRIHGVRLHAPVVSAAEIRPGVTRGSLVGEVTKVARNTAQVTLLVDDTSFVSVRDSRTSADGIVQHRRHGSNTELFIDRVTKDQVMTKGDAVVTAGWQSRDFESIYPRGIPVCIVTFVGQRDTKPFKDVLCKPFVDFGSLDTMIVLVSKKPQPVIPR